MKRQTRAGHSRDIEDAQSSGSGDIIRFLVQVYPEAVAAVNEKGELPLHAAVRGYQSSDTIAYLLAAFADSIRHKDQSGRTALHVAVSRIVSNKSTIALLIKADQDSTRVKDNDGNLPLHYCAKSTLDVVRL